MKKILLLSALLIFACSSDDSTSDDNNQNNSIIIDGSEYPLSRVEIIADDIEQTVYISFYDNCILHNNRNSPNALHYPTPTPFFEAIIGTYNEGFLASGTYQTISRTSDTFVGDADMMIRIYPYDNEADEYSSYPYIFSSLGEENDGVLNVERISSNNYSFSWNFVAKQGGYDFELESPYVDYPVVSGSYSGEVILLPNYWWQDCD